MTASARPRARASGRPAPTRPGPRPSRPLALTGVIAACAVTATGLVILTPLVVAGWIAAPRAGPGIPAILRTATVLWLAAHHVGFTLRGTGPVGLLPIGLMLLPGALLWRAGRWVVRAGHLSRLSEVGYAALALAAPYAVLSGALALASRSALASSSLPQAAVAGFGLALCAGGLGGARALAPWSVLARLLPPRTRVFVLAVAGALAVLTAVGAVLAGGSLAAHLPQYRALSQALGGGVVGSGLLLLAQLAYLPNAVGWAVSFTLGPGFAFGSGTVVAPTGVVLGPLPMFPMLAAIPAGAHPGVPAWASAAVLATPYLAGAFAGLLVVRAAPAATSLEVAPLQGLACGALTGCAAGMLAAFSGGPLGSGRLAEVGPSGWQVGLVTALQVGVAAAVVAGVVNWRRLRREAAAPAAGRAGTIPAPGAGRWNGEADGHRIYLDPWRETAGDGEDPPGGHPPPGPSALP